MLGPPESALTAGLYAVIVATGLLFFGYLLVDSFLHERVDMPTRLGLALAGVCAFSFLLMLMHMATRGALFSTPWAVRGMTLLVIAGLSLRKIGRRRGNGSWWLWLGVSVLVVTVVWGTPIFRMLPLTSTADTQLHNGWIRQLMNGESTPGGVITGDIPNYYPWLFHSLGALTTYLMPGRNPYYALGALQILISAGALLTWFAMGRALVQRATGGLAGALFGALAGGVGFVLLNTPDVIVNPRREGGELALEYGGDLLFTRSYNLAFHNLAPPFPRDLAFALMATFVLVLVVAVRRRNFGWFAGAGACLGLIGLSGGETFIASLVIAGLVMLAPWGLARWKVGAALIGPAVMLYSAWAIPILANYSRLDGFVNITHVEPVDLPFYAALIGWGIGVPFALYGIVGAARTSRTDPGARLVLVVTIGLIAALSLATLIPNLFGEAFDTLGRRHRYWPLIYLAIAALATVGAERIADSVKLRAAWLVATILVAGIALASPLAASAAVPTKVQGEPILTEALERERDSVLNVIDRAPGRECIAAVPQDIAREVFSFTGYRLVLWTGTWFGPNRARIRWAGIYDHIATDVQRIRDNRILVNGWGDPARWRDIADSYGVDIVVAPADHAAYRPFRGLPRRSAGEYVVFTVDRCG